MFSENKFLGSPLLKKTFYFLLLPFFFYFLLFTIFFFLLYQTVQQYFQQKALNHFLFGNAAKPSIRAAALEFNSGGLPVTTFYLCTGDPYYVLYTALLIS